MRTEQQQREDPAGTTDKIDWCDHQGQKWVLDITWGFVGSRVECVALALDSGGKAALTSGVIREAERFVRYERANRVKTVRNMAYEPGEVGRRAARQVSGYEAPSVGEQGGSRRNDQLWRRRAEVMREALLDHKPMSAALQKMEPDLRPDTIRKIIDRARAWDAETGAGLLEGVGRAKKQGGTR